MGVKHWNIDVDHWLNRFIPRNRLSKLPRPVTRFLGYRDGPHDEVGNVLVAWWAFVGAFTGVISIEAVFMIPEIHDRGVPIVIASFGAAAILEYNVIASPLAQPRNSIFGHFFSALVGVCVTKLFMLNPNFEDLRWVAGALACGLASAVMTLTKTVYPPAGATALLAAVDPTLSRLGWYLLPLVLLSAMLTLASSLLLNNIQRRYPLYWWTSEDLSKRRPENDIRKASDIEKTASNDVGSIGTEATQQGDNPNQIITIHADAVVVPDWFSLSDMEAAMLEEFRNRLKNEASSFGHPG